MDDKTALELLSDEFSLAPKSAAPAAATKLEPPVLDSDPLKVAQKMNCPQLLMFMELLDCALNQHWSF